MKVKKIQQLFNLFPEKPEKVFWWMALKCNLTCNHCDIGKNTHKQHDCDDTEKLSLQQKKVIVDRIADWIGKPFSLSFFAGEPLLNKDILPLIGHATTRGAISSITTNGTLIYSQEKAETIVNSGLTYISISLDGWKSGIHDKSRGLVGARQKVLDAVKYLQAAKKKLGKDTPKIYINSIIMKENLKDLIDIVKWVKRKKIDSVTFQPLAATEFFGSEKPYDKYWFKDSELWPDYDEVIKFIDKLEEMKAEGYPIGNSDSDFKKFRRYFKNPEEFALSESCEQELSTMSITDNGKIKMCPGSEEDFGSALDGDLTKMWRGDAARRARQHVFECTSQCKILAYNKEDFYF
ncbi:MAG: radical SAM protein [Candidatus Shapirobacteria bacterium]|jgi:MoaA/NifB/PqqE/SkfB family radical SAM enzyme